MWRFAIGTLVLAMGVAAPGVSPGATFTVSGTTDAVDAAIGDGVCASATGTCTLRAAVQEANATVDGDTITLPAGTFVLGLTGAAEDLAATGDLDVAHPLTVSGAGREATIIDGIGADRIFHVSPGSAFTVTDCTIRNGNPSDVGGAILHVGGAGMTLTNVAVRYNVATQGGGVVMVNGPLTVTGSAFDHNVASAAGGGGAVLHAGAMNPLEVRDSTFVRNLAAGPGGALLYAGSGAATVAGSTFSGNRGVTGGSLVVTGAASATVTNSVIEDSYAANTSQGGGGIIVATTVTLANTTVRRCTADDEVGGLLVNSSNGVTVTSSTFEENQAFGTSGIPGAGIINAAGTARVEDSTFRGNYAPTGSGGGLFLTSTGDAVLTRVTADGNSTGTAGGGAYVSAAMAITVGESRFTNNVAGMSAAGGLFALAGTNATITDSTFDGNTVLSGIGGGLYTNAGGDLLVEHSTFSNNLSLGGASGIAAGGYVTATNALTVRNSTISGNVAQGIAGGLFVGAATPLVEFCTFAGNEGLPMGAAYYSPGPSTVRGTAIGATASPSCAGVLPASGGDNVDQDGSCGLAAAGDRSGIDPQLGPLQNNGGPTDTHEPLGASPLLDGVTGGACPATDQRGVSRPTDGNGDGTATCDVGAVELVDECPSDPAKRLPGVCGCGVPDADVNANGAVDCLINAELKARIVTARSLMQSLTGDKTPEQTAARTQLAELADDLLSYCTTNDTVIVKTPPDAKLVKLAKKARKALRATRKSKGHVLAKKQQRAGKALDTLDAAVATPG